MPFRLTRLGEKQAITQLLLFAEPAVQKTPRAILRRFDVPSYNVRPMEIDLHGYHPRDVVWSGVLAKLVQQAWEIGESCLCLRFMAIGRNRGISPGFVNTNTDSFGLDIRRCLRHNVALRQWILHRR